MTFKSNENEFLVVPIPLDASDFYISELSYLCYKNPTPEIVDRLPLSGEYEILGLFFTKEKRLDFDSELIPLDPTLTGATRTNSEYHAEVASIILSELKKEFPLEVNPHGNKEQYLVTACEPGDLSHLLQEWRLAQSQVLPDRLLILRLIASGGTRVSASAVGDK